MAVYLKILLRLERQSRTANHGMCLRINNPLKDLHNLMRGSLPIKCKVDFNGKKTTKFL